VRARLKGGIRAIVGYLLSPLSWWNDAFINLPLAWVFASLVGLISSRLFVPAMVLGYWLTNIAGLWLLARGSVELATGDEPEKLKRRLVLSLAAATAYTVLIVLLAWLGVLKPLTALVRR
jgi:hypothetical protein